MKQAQKENSLKPKVNKSKIKIKDNSMIRIIITFLFVYYLITLVALESTAKV